MWHLLEQKPIELEQQPTIAKQIVVAAAFVDFDHTYLPFPYFVDIDFTNIHHTTYFVDHITIADHTSIAAVNIVNYFVDSTVVDHFRHHSVHH